MSPICKQIKTEKQFLLIALVVLALLGVLYTYLVSATVLHVVAQKELTQSISQMSSELSRLDAEYIAAQHNLSAHIAALPGFVETPDKIFIERSSQTLVVRDRVMP